MDIPTLRQAYVSGIDHALSLPWPLHPNAEQARFLQAARDTFQQMSDAQMQPFLDNWLREPTNVRP